MSSIRAARHAMCHSMPRRLHQLSTKGDLSLSLFPPPSSLTPSLPPFLSLSFPFPLPLPLSISLLFSLRAHFSLSLFLCRYINLLMPCFIFTRAHEYSDTSLYFFALFLPRRAFVCILFATSFASRVLFSFYIFFLARLLVQCKRADYAKTQRRRVSQLHYVLALNWYGVT